MDFVLSGDMLAILFFVALTAGFIDAMAGGGGLITIPALMLMQLPPILALGTNKLQGCSGSFTATVAMIRNRQITFAEMRLPFLTAFVGAGIGTFAVQHIDAKALDSLIPFILVGIGLYFLLSPAAGQVDSKPRLGTGPYRFLVIPVIGFYDGFFGPGTGTFWAIALVGFAGLEMQGATAYTKVANFTSNLVSLAIFISAGTVLAPIGLAMGLAEAGGAWAGSRLVLKRGAGLVRSVLMIVSVGVVLYIVAKYWIWR